MRKRSGRGLGPLRWGGFGLTSSGIEGRGDSSPLFIPQKRGTCQIEDIVGLPKEIGIRGSRGTLRGGLSGGEGSDDCPDRIHQPFWLRACPRPRTPTKKKYNRGFDISMERCTGALGHHHHDPGQPTVRQGCRGRGALGVEKNAQLIIRAVVIS